MVAAVRKSAAVIAWLAVAAHLTALYWPVVTVEAPVSWTDKVVHVLLFAAPTILVGRLLSRPHWAWAAFAAHAPLSELAQQVLLPGRSGDPWDMVADLVGVALGALALVVRRRVRR